VVSRRLTVVTIVEPRALALTRREREVLAWVAGGLTNREIGAELGISEHTVKNHLRAIGQRLHTGNRTEAVMRALQAGMLALEPSSNGLSQTTS